MEKLLDLRNPVTVRRLLDAAHRLLVEPGRSDVQGFALGYKSVGGKKTRDLALLVLVDRKPPQGDVLAAREPLVPPGGVVDAGAFLKDESFSGYSLLLDVQVVGKLTRLLPAVPVSTAPGPAPVADPFEVLRERIVPAFPGTSIAHEALAGAGTLGACLRDDQGNLYVLSNNHVLSLETGTRDGVVVGGRFGIAEVGDAVTQPGDEPPRVRQTSDVFATLADFIPLVYVGAAAALQANYCDAAIARVLDPASVLASFPYLGPNGGWVDVTSVAPTVRAEERVFKVGRTSNATQGTVTLLDVTLRLAYDAGDVIFDHQCLTTVMSAPGDSGSLVLGADGSAKGVLFGGSDVVSIFSPALSVLQLLSRHLGASLSLA